MNAIEVQDVSKRFRLYKDRPGSVKELFTKFGRPKYDEFWAVRNVDLEIPEGTVHGLVGHNGCGKSSLLRMIAGIHTPTSGRVITTGRISALLELGAGFHPELTGRENVYLNASILGLSRKQTDELFDRIVDFSGLEPFIDSPVKHYSSGMFVRLGFSVAVHVDPQILLIDEVIAVGDEEFQRRCLDHLRNLKSQGVTIVLVTHGMSIVQSMCDSATWMDHGRVLMTGEPVDVVSGYLNGVNDREAERDQVEAEAQESHRRSALTKPDTLQVDNLVVQHVDGTPASFAVSGDPIDLRIDWSASGRLPHPHMVIHIETPSGQHLATAHAPEGSKEPIDEGSWSVVCHFDSLPLAPGSYLIRATAVDPRTHIIHHVGDYADLVVRQGATVVEGLFALPVEWQERTRFEAHE